MRVALIPPPELEEPRALFPGLEILPEEPILPRKFLEQPDVIYFCLNCVPTAQQRPRHMRTRSGFDLTYKSAAQKGNEATLEALLAPHVLSEPLEGGVELRFVAVMPIPQSLGKKRREAMLKGFIGHTAKPDLDNLAKQLKDAMTRLRFWADDRQVARLIAQKRYGDKPCWLVACRTFCAGRR